MQKPDNDRIAIVETESTAHSGAIEKLTFAVEEISEQLNHIALEIAKGKSFVAGISFSFSLLGALLIYGIEYLLGHK